jgi:hypothetical protein
MGFYKRSFFVFVFSFHKYGFCGRKDCLRASTIEGKLKNTALAYKTHTGTLL